MAPQVPMQRASTALEVARAIVWLGQWRQLHHGYPDRCSRRPL